MHKMRLLFVFFFFLYSVIEASVVRSSSDEIIEENLKDLGDNIDFFEEGDMLIPLNAPLDETRKRHWPNGEVAYRMTSDYSAREKQIIRNALALITKAAPCIKFTEYTNNPPRAHVEVFKGSGCFSSVGRTGYKQQLSLRRGCLRSGSIIHEFLHALGFYHEQSRPDREDYIKINYQNIKSGKEHNFRKAKSIDSLGIEYDGESIMHYSGNAFSNGKGPTITWKADERKKLGSSKLSTKDKQQLNLLYCKDSPVVVPVQPKRKATLKPITKPPNPVITTGPPKRTNPTKRTNPPIVPIKLLPKTACGDTSGNCINVQFLRRSCNSGEKMRCPYSCNVCRKSKAQKCLNLKNFQGSCRLKAASGYCTTADPIKRYKFKVNCARSCCERNTLYAFPYYSF